MRTEEELYNAAENWAERITWKVILDFYKDVEGRGENFNWEEFVPAVVAIGNLDLSDEEFEQYGKQYTVWVKQRSRQIVQEFVRIFGLT